VRPPAASLSKLWQEIEDAGTPATEKLRLREAANVGGRAVLVGIDGFGRRHVCIQTGESDRGKKDRYSRGVSIEVRELLEGGVPRDYVDVRCVLPALNELFAVVASEMVDQLRVDASQPFNTCHQTLERWRELLEKDGTGLLGREQLAALFGELLVAEELVRRRGAALRTWVGPEKAPHDFMCGKIDIEVKTSLRTAGRFIEVNGLSQLDPPAGGALYLFFTRLRFSPGRGRSVPDVVASIAEKSSDQPLLFRLLADSGYDPAHRDSYQQITFEVLEELWFAVDDAFPRLTKASFVAGNPHKAVTTIAYTLDLDAIDTPPLGKASASILDTAAAAVTP
jgi:hypothetical protein